MFASKDTLLTRPSGYTIARSVRLRSSASAYFNRTPSSTTNQQKWTFSTWMKLGGAISGNTAIFVAGTTGSNFCALAIDGNNNVSIFWYVGASTIANVATSAKLRDPSAWYHLVVTVDTTQATAANRVIVYLNGVQQTSYASTTYPSQNYNGLINSNIAHYIGQYGTAGYNNFDGYLTEINFIDGQALTPSSFGETDSITGVWKPKKYSGTYGTNGFYLNFSDNSSNTATTIGKDYSGNGNNWTPNNISVTAGTTYDSMVDSPTTSATSSNYAVLNPLTLSGSGYTLSNGNLDISSTAVASVYSTVAVNTGKYYAEFTLTTAPSSAYAYVGVRSVTGGLYVYRSSDGQYYDNSTYSAYGASYTTNDVIGVAIDGVNGTITFYKNGTSQGQKTGLTIVNDTTYYLTPTTTAATGAFSANFGQRPFTYTPPTGFIALNTYNLPASTITNGAAYMAATTYSGNATAGRSIVNSGGFAPDFVWIKGRSTISNHYLYDSIRGVNNQLLSNANNAEATITDRMTAFNSNGFTIGSSSEVNGNTESYIGWQWKAGGTSSSNTNGSITSTVSANTTAGFSVVTYTGNGTSGATIGHGLGATPSMIIVKDRGGHSNNWAVWNSGFTTTSQTLFLDLTVASTTYTNRFDSSGFTSSVFKVGTTVGEVNTNTYTYVAYCFAAVAGYSAFGSYTGNGSTDGTFVYTGFRPRFMMVKRSDTTSNWVIIDTTRSPNNVVSVYMDVNLAIAEGNYAGWDIVSNGIKLRNTDAGINASGGTYIYMAFAKNPTKYALAR